MKKGKVEKWKAKNGNVCFRFPMHKTFERPWIIISAILVVAIICGVEFFVWGSYTLLIPASILLFMYFLWWVHIPAGKNEAIISQTVHEIMDKVADSDTMAVGAKVVKSMMNHDSKGTYGIVEASCFLVLLDNEEVWEYPLLYHKSDKNGAFFECVSNHVLSENQKHIRIINPKTWNRLIDSFRLSEKTSLGLLLGALLVIGGFSFAGFCWIVERFNWGLFLIFVGYVCILTLIEWLYTKRPNIFLYLISWVVSVPFVALYLILHSVLPFITILGTYFFVALFAFGVPAIVLTGLSDVGWLILRPETIAFVVFAVGSILCSNSYRTTKWMIHHSPLRDWGNHTYESYMEQLAVYLIHPSNVIFLLYLMYFIYLGISGYLQIQNGEYLVSEGFDSATLKAFLVYIAFTNMKAKAKDAEVDAKDLFQRTMKLFVHDK